MEEKTRSEIIDFLENRVQDCRVLVVGDIMLDRYFYGNVTRISPEAPVPVNLIDKKKNTLGGAANVAHNLAQLGCQTFLMGAIGDDHHGRLLTHKLEKRAIDSSGIVCGRDRTTTKIRILGGHQQMIRLDFEETEEIKDETQEELKQKITDRLASGIDAAILSDYGKGVCTKNLCQYVIRQAHAQHIPVFVDPKGTKWEKYQGADYVTPNVKEAGLVLGLTLSNDNEEVKKAAITICEHYDISNAMITRSEKGVSLYTDTGEIHVPTVAQEVYDVSGAGDTVISVFAAAIGAGLDPENAAQLANFAAGIEVSKLGTYAVSKDEILRGIKNKAE